MGKGDAVKKSSWLVRVKVRPSGRFKVSMGGGREIEAFRGRKVNTRDSLVLAQISASLGGCETRKSWFDYRCLYLSFLYSLALAFHLLLIPYGESDS